MKRRLWVAAFVAAAGIADIAFAVQIRTWHGRGSWTGVSDNKRFVASWLASMWVNLGLLLVGGTTLVLAVVLYLLYPRLAKR
jgi:hypothetical protein